VGVDLRPSRTGSTHRATQNRLICGRTDPRSGRYGRVHEIFRRGRVEDRVGGWIEPEDANTCNRKTVIVRIVRVTIRVVSPEGVAQFMRNRRRKRYKSSSDSITQRRITTYDTGRNAARRSGGGRRR
jgi:hypothetical protein